MTEAPWSGDACSLVDAFRSGDRSPGEELEATLAAIESSDLNATSFIDADSARERAQAADVNLPFGGVPTLIKELEPVKGWPYTEGSLVFENRLAEHTSTHVERYIHNGGSVPVGLSTSSEFGGLNISVTKLNGVTHNPWQHGRTVGGSSAGSASAVAGGLVSIATGGDGGGSIRIPAGYTGLLGMKGTFGRIPRGPYAYMRPNTVVVGCLARSVRDAARYYDVCAGPDHRDPSSIPNPGNWESSLGQNDMRGLRVLIDPSLSGVNLEPGVQERIRSAAEQLVKDHGMVLVEHDLQLPRLAGQWMMGNLATLLEDLGDRWPGCATDMTSEVSGGLLLAQAMYNLTTAASAEAQRIDLNEKMADAFDKVDLIIGATNPGPAFPAESTLSSDAASFLDLFRNNKAGWWAFRGAMGTLRTVNGAAPKLPGVLLRFAEKRFPELFEMGALTIPSNITGNPAASIPAGLVNGLPVGMQVLAAPHRDDLVFDVALAMERTQPWPLTAAQGLGAVSELASRANV